eukprot:12113377-Ditylum_brightwellii.AAC.1
MVQNNSSSTSPKDMINHDDNSSKHESCKIEQVDASSEMKNNNANEEKEQRMEEDSITTTETREENEQNESNS